MSEQLDPMAPHHRPFFLVPASGVDPLMVAMTMGSSCIVNAHTSNHEEISAKDTSTVRKIALHVVDGVGLVHAHLLRIQALLLPIKTLVFGGH